MPGCPAGRGIGRRDWVSQPNLIMNPTNPFTNNNTHLLDAVCRQGVLVATSVRYWRGCKKKEGPRMR